MSAASFKTLSFVRFHSDLLSGKKRLLTASHFRVAVVTYLTVYVISTLMQ
jgi:hypothetical protein